MKDPAFPTEMGNVPSEIMGVCPNCGNASLFTLLKIPDAQILDYIMESEDLHQGFVTQPFQFECSVCSNCIGVKFKIESIIKFENSFLTYRPPPERMCSKSIKERESLTKRKRLLSEHGVGNESDQDDTEQGRV